jgi:adenosylcobinamide kinase / adenosylcobinamide-phosphate guanylyltransferase
MGKITLICGGARSGKSSEALKKGMTYKRVAFVATCEARDDEMRQRIAAHKSARPRHWKTFEEPRDLEVLLGKIKGTDLVIIDCLTLLVSNLFLQGASRTSIEARAKAIMLIGKKQPFDLVLVSNEVGLGIVPANRLGRDFRDAAGSVNQIIAKHADEVIFMVCGIPLKIK